MNEQDEGRSVETSHLLKLRCDAEDKRDIRSLANMYELQFINWIFLLNSGGLIGSLTLLTSSAKYINLCVILAFIFSVGLILIIISCKLDHQNINANFDKKKDTYSPLLIDSLQIVSIILFFIGLIIAMVSIINCPY